MQSSFCARGHEVWWGELEGELVPFVRFTQAYALTDDDLDPEDESTARALRNCFRPHAEICESREFTRRRTKNFTSRDPENKLDFGPKRMTCPFGQ